MRAPPRTLGLAILCLVLLAGMAQAARDDSPPRAGAAVPAGEFDEDFRQAVIDETARAQAEYEQMRAVRLERLTRVADEALGVAALEIAKKNRAVRGAEPQEPEREGGSNLPLLVVGGGVLLVLLFRLRPWCRASGAVGRRRRKTDRAAGPLTVQLRPRAERRRGPAGSMAG